MALNTIYILTIPKRVSLAPTFPPNSKFLSRHATWHLQEMHLNVHMLKSAGLAFSPHTWSSSSLLCSVKDTTILTAVQVSGSCILGYFPLTSYFYSFSRSCCFYLKHICKLLWDLLAKTKPVILAMYQIITMWKKSNNLMYLRK